jgi:hypothetical protein
MRMRLFSIRKKVNLTKKHHVELNILIFSKNRACQLDSLLRSLRDNLSGPREHIFIVYKATDNSFREGYQRLIAKRIHGNLQWIEEVAFKRDILNVLQEIPGDSFLMFLVDDNILYRPFDLSPVVPFFSRRHLFVSLRCSREYKDDIQPKFLKTDKYLEWRWTFHSKPRGKWNYPFSVDGNIFHKDLICRLLTSLNFKAPNSLESALHSARLKVGVRWRNKALAPLESVVFNNPLNKVQTEGETWHKNLTAEDLNRKYCEGFIIDNHALYLARPDSAHFAIDIAFEKAEMIRS